MGTYIGVWDIFVRVNLGVVIFYGMVVLLYFALLLAVTGWRLTVDKDTIYYRNYFFITKQYKFMNLDKVIVKKSVILLRIEKEKRYF